MLSNNLVWLVHPSPRTLCTPSLPHFHKILDTLLDQQLLKNFVTFMPFSFTVQSSTLMYATFYTLLLCGKDIIALSLFSTGGVSKCDTLSNCWIECPLLFKHSTTWLVARRIDWLVAGVGLCMLILRYSPWILILITITVCYSITLSYMQHMLHVMPPGTDKALQ